MTKKERTLEELTNEKDQIREQLNALKALAESEKSDDEEKELENINKRINDLKKEISEKLKSSDITDEDREKLQQLDNELTPFSNELSSLKTSILSKAWTTAPATTTETSTSDKEEKWMFWKAWDWTKDQWDSVRDGEKWKDEPWKNALRTAWFVVTWVWAISLLYKGIKKLFWKDKKKEVKESEQKTKKSFWQRPFGKFLKWSAITAWIVWGVYAIWKSCWWWRTNPELEKPSNNNWKPVPQGKPSDNQWGWWKPAETPSNKPKNQDEWKEWNDEVASVEPAIMADSLLKYFDDNVSAIKIKWEERENIKNDLLTYFSAHPILKIDKNSNMTFNIDDKWAFEQMLRNMVERLKKCVGWLKRAVINKAIGSKLDNVSSTVADMNKKNYEKIILKYLGWMVKEVAIAKNANLTIGNLFDSVVWTYPNGNSEEIRNDMASKWAIERDIKTLEYPI